MEQQILCTEEVSVLQIGNKAKITIVAKGHENGYRKFRIEESVHKFTPVNVNAKRVDSGFVAVGSPVGITYDYAVM